MSTILIILKKNAMAKVKTSFFCQNCGYESPKWLGKCPSCDSWNTFAEEIITKKNANASSPFSVSKNSTAKAKKIPEIQTQNLDRIALSDPELNRVLGGGIVPGSLTLFGGEPGIGKSTLLLQTVLSNKLKVLYVSGEESEQQIRMRAERIAGDNPECYILTETNTQHIFLQLEQIEPEFVIIDSIQTLHTATIESSPGSVSQIRECTAELLRYAKQSNTPIFLIGHITKDGNLAGPKILEHMVDTVLQFEGDRNHVYRLLRAVKNRFGSTNELGIYEMLGDGLRAVENPSELLISNSLEELSGTTIGATIEGARPLLIEIQALVSTAVYGTPQRSSTGFDIRRLNMLLAVLEKKYGFKLGAKDVFLNITGGIKVIDPAMDLAITVAVISSNADLAVPKNTCFAGEVGLNGEIRAVSRIDQRINEAQKLGFEKIFISAYNKGIKQENYDIELVKISKITDALKIIFA